MPSGNTHIVEILGTNLQVAVYGGVLKKTFIELGVRFVVMLIFYYLAYSV